MALVNEREFVHEGVTGVARLMAMAARTAPKARGNDNLTVMLADGDTIRLLSDKMKELGLQCGSPIFARDAENILKAEVVVLFGTKISVQGLKKCGMCGHQSCDEKLKFPDVPCVFNCHDLGLAVGSAVSVAAMHHIDNRVMYTVGQAVLELGLLGPDVKIAMGVPLSVSGKSPFFDRPPVS